jgi:hypothetical protein
MCGRHPVRADPLPESVLQIQSSGLLRSPHECSHIRQLGSLDRVLPDRREGDFRAGDRQRSPPDRTAGRRPEKDRSPGSVGRQLLSCASFNTHRHIRSSPSRPQRRGPDRPFPRWPPPSSTSSDSAFCMRSPAGSAAGCSRIAVPWTSSTKEPNLSDKRRQCRFQCIKGLLALQDRNPRIDHSGSRRACGQVGRQPVWDCREDRS